MKLTFVFSILSLVPVSAVVTRNCVGCIGCDGNSEELELVLQGYSNRLTFAEFRKRYAILAPSIVSVTDNRTATKQIIKQLQVHSTMYRLSKSEIFLRYEEFKALDKMRTEIVTVGLLGQLQDSVCKCRGVKGACNKYTTAHVIQVREMIFHNKELVSGDRLKELLLDTSWRDSREVPSKKKVDKAVSAYVDSRGMVNYKNFVNKLMEGREMCKETATISRDAPKYSKSPNDLCFSAKEITIVQEGFSDSLPFNQFLEQYGVVARYYSDAIPKRNEAGALVRTEKLVEALQLDQSEYRIGDNRIFFKNGIHNELDDIRDKIIVVPVDLIQRSVRKHLALRKWSWWKLFILVKPLLSRPDTEKSHPSRKRRTTSNAEFHKSKNWTTNVFAMFDQSQIQEFKEAFNMIDQNRDGFVDKEDLQDILSSLGKTPKDTYVEGMMKEAPGPINFTMFLTLFGEKLNSINVEALKNAFRLFDEDKTDFISIKKLRELLMKNGNRLTAEEFNEMIRGAPIRKGDLNYVELINIMERGYKSE